MLQYAPSDRSRGLGRCRARGRGAVPGPGRPGRRRAHPGPRRLRRPRAIPGIDALCAGLAANGLVLELLLRPSPAAARWHAWPDASPRLAMVLCHMGIGQDPIEEGWEAELATVAAHANVHAKLSGILSTDADDAAPRSPGADCARRPGVLRRGPAHVRQRLAHVDHAPGWTTPGCLRRIDAELPHCTARSGHASTADAAPCTAQGGRPAPPTESRDTATHAGRITHHDIHATRRRLN